MEDRGEAMRSKGAEQAGAQSSNVSTIVCMPQERSETIGAEMTRCERDEQQRS